MNSRLWPTLTLLTLPFVAPAAHAFYDLLDSTDWRLRGAFANLSGRLETPVHF